MQCCSAKALSNETLMTQIGAYQHKMKTLPIMLTGCEESTMENVCGGFKKEKCGSCLRIILMSYFKAIPF